MSRIAIVSYFAPPQPAVASHRVLRMTRLLERHGHEVHWVTLDPALLPERDPTLAALTPASVVVHGLGGVNLVDRDAENLVEKVVRTVVFALPHKVPALDRHVEWGWRLRRRLPRIVREAGVDTVLLCCGPHGQLTALPALRRACPDVRILVDYRDLLSGNTWRQAPSERLRAGVRRRERALLGHADVLFLNTADARQKFEETIGPIDGLRIELMRNTADYELAERVAEMAAPVDFGPGTHLGFFGTVYPRRRLLPLLRAMAALEAAELERLTLHVYCDARGSADLLEEDLNAVGGAVRQRVIRHDFLGYGDALRTMLATDALVLINSPDAADQIFIPGKLYDYLMARRPILFFGDRGDAWEICAETTGDGWCFTHEETAAAADRLRRLIAARPADVPESDAHRPEASFAPLLAALR